MLQHKYSTTQPHYNTNVKEHLHGITKKTSTIQHNVPTNQMHGTTKRLEIKTSIVQPENKSKEACCNSKIAQRIHGTTKKQARYNSKLQQTKCMVQHKGKSD
jgi:hypothetical protein